jgi:hypothetical protein
MHEQETAAWELHEFFRSLGLPYAVIGGLAVQWWGEPRVTRDVDLTAATPLDQPSSVFVQQVLDRFPARIDNALEFTRRSRVILITASNGCPADSGPIVSFMYNTSRPAARPGGFVIRGYKPRPGRT